MARRNSKTKRRKLAAVKVKFGPSNAKDVPKGDDYEFPLLARRGSGPWAVVGEVVAQVTDVDYSLLNPRYLVVQYEAELDEAGVYDPEVYAPAGSHLGRIQRRRAYQRDREGNLFADTHAAKKAIKEWAAGELEDLGWPG